MTNTNDLRYVRTEEVLRSAFMSLVSQQPIESITASAVCRQAGISRNAFYLHYSGVSALYTAMMDELLADVRAECIASSERVLSSGSVDEEFSSTILGVLAAHENLLRALLAADDGLLTARLADGLEAAYVDAALLFGERGSSFEHRLMCAFAAGAHVGLLRRWISQTDHPLMELLPRFSKLQAGISGSATDFLAGPPATS